MGDILVSRGDEGRGRLRKVRGRSLAFVNPEVSEWGNPSPAGNRPASSMAECIGHEKPTQGTETSKYLQERKSTETPSVAASESGIAQTDLRIGVAGVNQELQRQHQMNGLESPTTEGDSPVVKSDCPPLRLAYQSSTELVELRVKLGGPPSKAKYSSTTDSEK